MIHILSQREGVYRGESVGSAQGALGVHAETRDGEAHLQRPDAHRGNLIDFPTFGNISPN